MHDIFRREGPAASLPVVSETILPGLRLLQRCRNKDLYDLGETLLVVHTDRGGDSTMPLQAVIPGRGQLGNQLSAYWFQRLREVFPNHFLSAEVENFPAPCQPHAAQLAGRSMLVKKATPLPVRCLVRGYLTEEGWREYQRTGGMAGATLPSGMLESQRLPVPLFVPIVDGDQVGTDFATLEAVCGVLLAEKLRSAALHLYFKAWKIARYRGILIAESSFEFGLHEGALLLIDDCITQYTSRFWSLESYKPGRALPVLADAGLLSRLRGRVDR